MAIATWGGGKKYRTIAALAVILLVIGVGLFLFFKFRVGTAPSRLSPTLQQKQLEEEQEAARQRREQQALQEKQSHAPIMPPKDETPEQRSLRQTQEANYLRQQYLESVASISSTAGGPILVPKTEEEMRQMGQRQDEELDNLRNLIH
jgi:hypothetical protein